jgi:hypothetical protein
VKDLAIRNILIRSNSPGKLYPYYSTNSSTSTALSTTVDGDLWHKRLGHSGLPTLSCLSRNFLRCNNVATKVCMVCLMGQQPRQSFSSCKYFTIAPLQIIQCDLWTSPIATFTGHHHLLRSFLCITFHITFSCLIWHANPRISITVCACLSQCHVNLVHHHTPSLCSHPKHRQNAHPS